MYTIIITCNVTASGSIKAVRENPAVPEQVLLEILLWKLEGAMEVSDEERSRFNQDLIEYILEELIPWYKQSDYSTLEVNQ